MFRLIDTVSDSNGIRPILDIPLGPLAVIDTSHLLVSPISTSTPNQQRTFGDRLVVEDMEIDKSDEHTNKKSVYHSNHRLSQHERESKVTVSPIRIPCLHGAKLSRSQSGSRNFVLCKHSIWIAVWIILFQILGGL